MYSEVECAVAKSRILRFSQSVYDLRFQNVQVDVRCKVVTSLACLSNLLYKGSVTVLSNSESEHSVVVIIRLVAVFSNQIDNILLVTNLAVGKQEDPVLLVLLNRLSIFSVPHVA